MYFNTRTKGFTLIELLVVIAIIGILAALVTASISGARADSRDAARLSQAKQFQTALELYLIDYNSYPCGRTNDCDNLSQTNFNQTWPYSAGGDLVDLGYIKSIPEDPIFGTDTSGGGCQNDDATGYCYCSSNVSPNNYGQSYVLSVELENADRCLIMEGPNADQLCPNHTSGRVECSTL